MPNSRGLLGDNIFGTGLRTANVDIMEGAGAFVCGEETALIASIEGQPRRRRGFAPPTPPNEGLWGTDRRW